MAERDFAAERLHSYDVSKNLSGLPYRLNAFVFFQGLNNFLGHAADAAVSFIPFLNKTHDSSSHIENTIRLSRFRNLHTKVV